MTHNCDDDAAMMVGCVTKSYDKSGDKSCYGVATISRLLELQVSFAKEPYKRDYILQKKPIILRSLLTVATPYLRAA